MHLPGFAYFVREMRLLSRSRFHALLRSGVGLVYLFASSGLAAASAVSAMPSAPGAILLSVFVHLNKAIILLVSVLYFSTALGDEKDAQSRDLLLITGLGPVSMLLGASVSRQCVAWVLTLIQIPLLLLTYALGGVAFSEILSNVLEVLLFLLVLSNLMLVASVVATHERFSMLAGFILVVIWTQAQEPLRAWVEAWSGDAEWAWPAGRLACALAFFLTAALLLRLRIAGHAPDLGNAPITPAVPSVDAKPRRRVPLRFPLAWKDIHHQEGGIRWRNIRGAAIVGFVALVAHRNGLSLLTTGWAEWVRLLGLIAQAAGWLALFLEMTVACNGFVRREKEEKTLEVLFCLPIASSVLLRDKLLAALYRCLPFVVLCVVGHLAEPKPLLALLTWSMEASWHPMAVVVGLGHVLAFWTLTMVFSYTTHVPGWLVASLVTGASLIFYASILGVLVTLVDGRQPGSPGNLVILLLMGWLILIGGWVLRELYKDFSRNLVYPES